MHASFRLHASGVHTMRQSSVPDCGEHTKRIVVRAPSFHGWKHQSHIKAVCVMGTTRQDTCSHGLMPRLAHPSIVLPAEHQWCFFLPASGCQSCGSIQTTLVPISPTSSDFLSAQFDSCSRHTEDLSRHILPADY